MDLPQLPVDWRDDLVGPPAPVPDDTKLHVHDEAPESLKCGTWAGIICLPSVVSLCTKWWSPHADPDDAVVPPCDELPEIDEAEEGQLC